MALATVGANRVFASGLVDYRILYQYLQRGWQSLAQKDFSCVLRILLVRFLETAVVEFLCRNRLHKMLSPYCWSGPAAVQVFLWC